MVIHYKHLISLLFIGTFMMSATQAATAEKTVHVYNWSDYIAQDSVQKFEQQSGIKVDYNVFDSNEVLEGKLMAGNSGYDIVVPSSSFLARQLKSAVFQPLDKSKLPNYKNLDPVILQKVALHDPGNRYAIPYLWATTGIGYNVDKVKEILGPAAPLDSWDLIFKKENLQKLKRCGVAFLDAPEEIYALALNYLGKDPASSRVEDYTGAATELLLNLRSSIRYFNSSQYINDLASGNICVAIGWSGDVLQAKKRANQANNGAHLAYTIPKEGALAFFDVMAIPKDAANLDAAYAWLNYILEPQVIASISDAVFYANANKAAFPLVDPAVRDNPEIYPTQQIMEKLFVLKVQDAALERARTRAWTVVKRGQ